MKKKPLKRSSYVRYTGYQELKVKPMKFWGYNKRGDLVCRVEVNHAGVAVYGGKFAQKHVANVNWEQLVERLTKSR